MFWFFFSVLLSLGEHHFVKKGEEKKSKSPFATLLFFLHLDYYQIIKHEKVSLVSFELASL